MSHFTIGVILPKSITPTMPEAIDSYIQAAMYPFNEGLEVQPYDHTCDCDVWAAKSRAADYADKVVGIGWREGERRYNLEDPQRAEWWETKDSYLADHPENRKHDPACDECHGTGVYKATYNPNSKWDGWVIGGRWDGTLTGNEQSSDNGFNFADKHHTIANNHALLSDLLKRADPPVLFGYVTPVGEWIERGSMGWWGIVTDEADRDKWKESALKVMQHYADHYIVNLDCHI